MYRTHVNILIFVIWEWNVWLKTYPPKIDPTAVNSQRSTGLNPPTYIASKVCNYVKCVLCPFNYVNNVTK